MESWLLEYGEDLQVALFFGLIVLLAVAEKEVSFRRFATSGRRRIANWGMTALNVLMLPVLPVGLIGAAVWAKEAGFGVLNRMQAGMAGALIVTLLVRGFISFFTHYLMHKVPALWALHRVHHLDTEVDVSTTVRIHPLELVIGLVPGITIVVASGLTPWVLVLYEILDVAVTLVSHANISLPRRLERWLRYVIVTPDLHRVHHSSWQPETDSNFSAVFPVWDLALGTFRTETREPQRSMELGLEDVRDARASSIWWLLCSPFRSAGSATEIEGGKTI